MAGTHSIDKGDATLPAPELYQPRQIISPLPGLDAIDAATLEQYRALGFVSVADVFDTEQVEAARAGLSSLIQGEKPQFDGVQFEQAAAERLEEMFMFLGAGNQKKGTSVSHHNPHFNIDEETLPDGVAMHVKGALNFFKHADKLKFLSHKRR
jgi:hypothetical protein